jgi:hypothetical protein
LSELEPLHEIENLKVLGVDKRSNIYIYIFRYLRQLPWTVCGEQTDIMNYIWSVAKVTWH